MKPKTKIQRQIIELSRKLPQITAAQRKWGLQNCLEHKGYRTKQGIVCLDCGHQWKEDIPASVCVCPSCGAKLTAEDTRKRNDKQYAYYCIMTTCSDFQVLRFFEIQGIYAVRQPARLYCKEVVQQWIRPNGRYEYIARKRNSFYYCAYSWHGDMELRTKSMLPYIDNPYNIYPQRIYPKKNIIPEIKRNGFDGHFYGIAPLTFLRLILNNSRAETLLKSKQISLLKKCAAHIEIIEDYWSSIRICLRNKYIVSDADIWLDYLYTLKVFGRDILNAKYVCPPDLVQEHDRWVEKKRIRDEIVRLREQRERAIADEAAYLKARGQFFDLKITDRKIEVVVLTSVREVMEEGDALHHCVFTNDYYKRADSLLMSARHNGQRLETVEFSLKNMEVVQCRGLHNKSTKYHEDIINLVNKNKNLIRKRMTA